MGAETPYDVLILMRDMSVNLACVWFGQKRIAAYTNDVCHHLYKYLPMSNVIIIEVCLPKANIALYGMKVIYTRRTYISSVANTFRRHRDYEISVSLISLKNFCN